jgi:hypothetical protein
MRERRKARTLVARDEGDDANGVLKLFKDFGDRLRQGPVGLEELNRLASRTASGSSTTGFPA